MANSVARKMPAALTHSVVRNPERIHCRGRPVSTPCQSIDSIIVITPDATDLTLFAENAGCADAVVG